MFTRITCTLTLLVSALFVAPAPASADLLTTVTCTFENNVTYEPGVKNEPQETTITVNQHYTSCSVVNGFPITMAQDSVFTLNQVRSCANILGTRIESFSITWNTGQTSFATVTSTYTQEGSVLIVSGDGQIFSGPFIGMRLRRAVTYPNVDLLLACSSEEGLTGLHDGMGITTITAL